MTTPPMGRLDGKVALVTGASRGIGLAIAAQLVAQGAKVALTARKDEALQAAIAELGGPDVALGIAGAADDEDHQRQAVDAIVERFGALDLLVNNAGINPAYGSLLDLEPAAARKIFEVNVIAALGWTRQAHRAWLREHGGAVVNIASVAGVRPSPGIGMYGASKSALIHLTQELAWELGPTVRVNAVAPAVVKTRFAQALYAGREEEVSTPYPLKRLGEPEDIAGAVAFLLSDSAAWITGQTLIIDGGITLLGGA